MRKIPAPIDVIGQTITFRPSETSDILTGEVVGTGFQWPYPKDEKGQRQLLRKITVMLPDGRLINMKAEQEDIKRYRMVAENQKATMTW